MGAGSILREANRQPSSPAAYRLRHRLKPDCFAIDKRG